MKYNARYAQKWDFSGLHAFFTKEMEPSESGEFFSNILPKMIALALRLPTICTRVGTDCGVLVWGTWCWFGYWYGLLDPDITYRVLILSTCS